MCCLTTALAFKYTKLVPIGFYLALIFAYNYLVKSDKVPKYPFDLVISLLSLYFFKQDLYSHVMSILNLYQTHKVTNSFSFYHFFHLCVYVYVFIFLSLYKLRQYQKSVIFN